MARIKIEDLPEHMETSDQEIERVFGGSAASWYSWRANSVMKQQWITPDAKIIGSGVYAYETKLATIIITRGSKAITAL